MAILSYQESKVTEQFLEMGAGYVLDFSDRTIAVFVGGSVGLDINDEKYKVQGTSKANRLRQFIKTEQDYTVGKLFKSLYEYNVGEYNRKGNAINYALFEEFHIRTTFQWKYYSSY